MSRCGCLVSSFLIAISIGLLLATVVIPVIPAFENNETIDKALQAILCQEGETIRRAQYSRPTDEGTSYSMNVYCETMTGSREVTSRWMLIGMAAFLAPFLIGLFGVIGFSMLGAKNAVQNAIPQMVIHSQTHQAFNNSQAQDALRQMGIRIGGEEWGEAKPAQATLTDRLAQLEQAHKAGLISMEEYMRLRQQVLDAVDDM